jgi:hypothetical protein
LAIYYLEENDMKLRGAALVLVTAGLWGLLGSCEVFTTSWGTWAARKDLSRSMPEVNSGNVKDMVFEFAGDPDASLALLGKIAEAVKGTTDPNEKSKLRAAALDAAINASGMTQVFIDHIGVLLETASGSDEIDVDEMFSIFDKIEHTEAISNQLVTIIPTKKADPKGFQDLSQEAGSATIVMGALILVVAEKGNKSIEEYIEDLDPDVPSNTKAELAIDFIEAGAGGSFSGINDRLQQDNSSSKL